MWRVVTSTIAALALGASAASAQQPCTTDASRVVAEVYRHTLERGPDPAAQNWTRQLQNGQLTVKELVRNVAGSQEYMRRFGQTEAGEGQPYERAVARLYRHILGRQPDANGQRNWARTAQQRGLGVVVDGLIDSAEYNNSFGDWGVPGSGGLRFCANAADNQSSVAPRFQGLDRNNDGVVSRSEWRGNNVGFNNQDTNNDGVLSRDELLEPAGRRLGRRSDYDFDALDVNNNNRIERREWQARLDQFSRLDTNGDNFLTRAELDRDDSSVGTSGNFIAVASNRTWTDTGINVNAGQTVTISADGRIRIARDAADFITASGADSRVADAIMPSAPIGGLVARFGNSAPVFVGQNRTFRAPRSGRLYLGVNDSFWEDNTGQFNATVDVN
jgi:Ca2+-binding EF-hand superfamily protein